MAGNHSVFAAIPRLRASHLSGLLLLLLLGRPGVTLAQSAAPAATAAPLPTATPIPVPTPSPAPTPTPAPPTTTPVSGGPPLGGVAQEAYLAARRPLSLGVSLPAAGGSGPAQQLAPPLRAGLRPRR